MAAVVALLAMPSERVAADEPVAPFKLKELGGRTFDSKKELPGRVTILSFWRLEQKHSRRILKDLAKLHEEFASEGVGIVAVICEEPDSTQVEQVVAELKLEFRVLFDPDRSLYSALGAKVCPSSWFIDREGSQRFAYAGHRRDFPLVAQANIELLLGRISEPEREARLERKAAPPSRGTVGGPVRYRMAHRLLKEGKRDAGKEQLLQAWQGEPQHATAGVDLGLLLLEDGENEQALELLEQAAELVPEDPRATGAKGLALIRAGRTDEGQNLLRQALESDVAEPLFYYEMAVLSESQGATEEAYRYYKRGFQLMIGRPRPSQ